MADVTVSQLAESVGTPVDRLLQQMQEAGLPQKSETALVSEDEKQSLLAHIKKTHGESDEAPAKITLKRRTLSTLKTAGSAGRGRTVNVEVRKKRTYVRDDAEDVSAVAAGAEAPEVAAVESAPLAEVAELVSVPVEPVIPEVIDPAVAAQAMRRAAQAEAAADAERRRDEAQALAAELLAQTAREEALKAGASKDSAKTEGRPATEKELEELRVSARKDKRDRSDLDDADTKEKRVRQGGRKRRVEALIEDEGDDLIVGGTPETSTLGLSASRGKRSKAKPAA
jgi:translation initiation factor IF-2